MSSGAIRETVYLSQTNSTAKEAPSPSPPPELKTLDQRLDTLSQDHISPSPYLLAIQSRRQFHLSDYQVREEFRESETGFKPEERDLQYLTFLPDGWNQTILSVLSSKPSSSDTPKLKVMASTNAAPKSVAKKTISIDDYNKKRSSLPARTVNGSSAADNIKNRAVSNHPSGSSSSIGLKRSSDALEKPKPRVAGDAPPAKKLKPSPHPAANGSKSPQPKSKTALPPSLRHALPALLEKSLSHPNDATPKAKTSGSIPVNKAKQPNLSTNLKSAASQEIVTPKRNDNVEASAKHSSQTSKTVPNGLHNSSLGAQHKQNNLSVSEKEATKATPMAREKSASRPSVIVRLKIPKDRRKDVSRLLRLTTKAERDRKLISKTNTNVHEVKKAVDRPSVAGKSSDKRPREDGLDVQPERKRSRSPAFQEQVASKKLRESTPTGKDEVKTPQGAATAGTPNPPASVSKKPRDKATPTETGSVDPQVAAKIDELAKLQKKYSELGVVLKKEGDKLMMPDMSSAQRNKFIAGRIETTLAFMLAYTIGDEVQRLRKRAPAPEYTWDSLFRWLKNVHEWVSNQHHLSGLLLQLEGISLMVVWRQRSDLAETEETISLKKARELRALCEEAQRKFMKGSARLSVDDLQNEFPKTWKAKATQPPGHLGYKLSKDNLNGDFYLPLTSISLPIEGVRAGKTFLAEWCRREGVEWTAKLDF